MKFYDALEFHKYEIPSKILYFLFIFIDKLRSANMLLFLNFRETHQKKMCRAIRWIFLEVREME